MNNKPYKQSRLRYLGIEPYRVSHAERLISAFGAFIGISLIIYCSQYFLVGISSYLIVASMGASAVLLFAVPHGRLSQPWPLLGGHTVSALIGVICAKTVPDITLAAAIAVGMSVAAMYYLHCIHPPGGATALTAVVGGSTVADLGFSYILTPVLLNTLIILFVAICFNYFFQWRRYPAVLAKHERNERKKHKKDNTYGAISHEDFVYALSEIDSLLDVSENDLLRIYDLVTQRHQFSRHYSQLVLGHYYSNGAYGEEMSVRQIIDWREEGDENSPLIYKIIVGVDINSTGTISKKCFSRWAKNEVVREDDDWKRVDSASDHTTE